MRAQNMSAISLSANLVVCALLFSLTTGTATAQQSGSDQVQSDTGIVFMPPDIGAPADRVGAGTRDIGQDGHLVTLLVPDGGGMTTLHKPPLVWYLSEAFAGEMQSQIVPVNPPGDGASKIAEGRFQKGFYALDLSRSDLVLKPGAIYEWKVVLLDSGTDKYFDQKSAYVQVTDIPPAASAPDVAELAAAGLWFDALAPFVEIGLSGRVRVAREVGFGELVSSAGVVLP